MSYILTYAKYLKAEGNVEIAQYRGGKRPRNAIRGGFGTYAIYTGDGVPARFYMYFKNAETGEEHSYDAYPRIKKCMVGDRLTEKRRNKIASEVAKIAAVNDKYDPDNWVATAVRKLDI